MNNLEFINKLNNIKSNIKNNNKSIQKSLTKFFDLACSHVYLYVDSLTSSIEVRPNVLNGDVGNYPLNKMTGNHLKNFYWKLNGENKRPSVPTVGDADAVIDSVILFVKRG